jgi:hypothetical protein
MAEAWRVGIAGVQTKGHVLPPQQASPGMAPPSGANSRGPEGSARARAARLRRVGVWSGYTGGMGLAPPHQLPGCRAAATQEAHTPPTQHPVRHKG